MLNINRQGLRNVSSRWADGAVSLEAGMSAWCRSIEVAPISHVNCSLSLWSNEFYLLAAVASFTLEGNSEDELAIEFGFHRNSPDEMSVQLAASICREHGAPLAVMPPRKMPLDASASVAKADLESAIRDFHSFLIAESALVAKQIASMGELVQQP